MTLTDYSNYNFLPFFVNSNKQGVINDLMTRQKIGIGCQRLLDQKL